MGIVGFTTDEIFNLPEQALYALLAEAKQDASPAHAVIGGIANNNNAQKMAARAFFDEFTPATDRVAQGKIESKKIWAQIRSHVCSLYISDYKVMENKTLFDALLAALATLVSTNPLIAIVLAIAIKTGLDILCEVPKA